jgi:hypothetical protein
MNQETMHTIKWKEALQREFPKAIEGTSLSKCVIQHLSKDDGFTPENTIFGNSTCPDELNRTVTSLGNYYGVNFPMGGLAGYPFAGISGFNAFAHHAPNNTESSNIIILYGPHIGIDEEGRLGSIKRKGMKEHTTACGSAVGAFNSFKAAWERGVIDVHNFDVFDQQQHWIHKIILAYGKKIIESEQPMKLIVQRMWKIIDKAIHQIVSSPRTSFNGRIALIGGIQINTPVGEPSYFLPKRFEIFDKRTGETKDCMDKVKC